MLQYIGQGTARGHHALPILDNSFHILQSNEHSEKKCGRTSWMSCQEVEILVIDYFEYHLDEKKTKQAGKEESTKPFPNSAPVVRKPLEQSR